MTLFIISIPLMLAAVALAVVPLLVASHTQHRRRATVARSRPRATTPTTSFVDEEQMHERAPKLAA